MKLKKYNFTLCYKKKSFSLQDSGQGIAMCVALIGIVAVFAFIILGILGIVLAIILGFSTPEYGK